MRNLMQTVPNPKCDWNAKTMGLKKGQKWIEKSDSNGSTNVTNHQNCAKTEGKKQKQCNNNAKTLQHHGRKAKTLHRNVQQLQE